MNKCNSQVVLYGNLCVTPSWLFREVRNFSKVDENFDHW